MEWCMVRYIEFLFLSCPISTQWTVPGKPKWMKIEDLRRESSGKPLSFIRFHVGP